MAEYLGISGRITNVSFIPSKGASQMHLIASILIGWGQDFVSIVDNDKAGNNARKDLKELNVEDEKIIFASSEKNTEIEDLFTSDDFLKYVMLDAEANDEGKRNSALVKNSADKVILAKVLFDKIRSNDKPEFSSDTVSAFSNLFDNVLNAFQVPEAANSDTVTEEIAQTQGTQ